MEVDLSVGFDLSSGQELLSLFAGVKVDPNFRFLFLALLVGEIKLLCMEV